MITYYKKSLVHLFESIQELKINPSNINLCYYIQEKLLRHIKAAESKIRAINLKNEDLNFRIKNARLPKMEASLLKSSIAENLEVKAAYFSLLSVYRDIGDGIAFIYINKWDIKPMALDKEHAGFISKKKGLRFELKAFRMLKSNSIIAIFNDITNSLRHGDLTIPNSGSPIIFELKSGASSANSSRAQRQITKAQNVLDYLKTDVGVDIYKMQNGIPMYRFGTVEKERFYGRELTEMMQSALRDKKSFIREVEKGLYYSVVFNESDIDSVFSKLPKSIKPILMSVNDRKGRNLGCYPFTLSISDPHTLYEFYSGSFVSFIIVDAIEIDRQMSRKKFSVSYLDDNEYFLELTHIDTGSIIKLSNHFFGRLVTDFLSLKWFLTHAVSNLNEIERLESAKPVRG
jgi:hypothetical protein